jgi:hypothetical protein
MVDRFCIFPANIFISANHSGNIPVNSPTAGQNTLDDSLPQNVIGAINELVGKIGPGRQRIAYTLVNRQIDITTTNVKTIAYFPWIGSRYFTSLRYTNGVVLFQVDGIFTDELILELVGTKGVLNSTATTSGNGFYTFDLDQNLPGVTDEQLFLRVRKATLDNALDINIFGVTLEWDTS